MWIKRLLGSRSGCPLGSHAWILIAMFQLAMDFTTCDPVAGSHRFRLLQRPSPWHRLSHSPLWSFKNGQELRIAGPSWTYVSAHPDWLYGQIQRYRSRRPRRAAEQPSGSPARSVQAKQPAGATAALPLAAGSRGSTRRQPHVTRGKRHLRGSAFRQRDSRATAVPEVIVWGPTGEEDSVETSMLPGNFGSTTATSAWQARATTVATTTTTALSTTALPKGPSPTPASAGGMPGSNPGRRSTTEPYAGHSGNGKEARPPRILGDTSGLAVHQIITITVSLIMVIAALITTLVLKNCCVQSGNTRRNSHQRKINQQEESCQNLTDFTPARVPSNLDIFTAYNETLQCSHECVRTPVPVYTEEALHSPGDYKTTFNGNRSCSPGSKSCPGRTEVEVTSALSTVQIATPL
ncbi:adherens junction-associated protein 1 isoform X2 [Struthio camelus]|uniref:adherens junction-associated protein 1 isoform X2 n=2 Tax=Struthio camelus TaxID=8801 RepID=UPI003603C4FA